MVHLLSGDGGKREISSSPTVYHIFFMKFLYIGCFGTTLIQGAAPEIHLPLAMVIKGKYDHRSFLPSLPPGSPHKPVRRTGKALPYAFGERQMACHLGNSIP